ncbi:hypothetical protein [Falsiroseomonas tokyonensis]|uniref:Uncharacterized protein n=1 Tax=Falsiroseomonas tokyonensis TaxID=430521 RepID=A0ABV7BXJ0_9PROT|nr:hypothetical protein [Falsiroseomonas tokyonensis]MBU8540238.1 hypothetical protein [Falsiroseomonas tokyonensis]
MPDLAPQRYGALPVPVTAAWSVEQDEREPRVVRWRCGARGELRFTSDGVNRPGEGKPLFTILHADRCRAVIERGLCQMCVRPLPHCRICMTSGATLQGLPLVSDGLPMCPACAMTAYRACIGLQRNEAAGRLRIYAVEADGWVLSPKVLGIVSGPGADERVNALIRKHGKLYAGPDLQLRRFRRLALADLEGMLVDG